MGLDMYLNANRFIWRHNEKDSALASGIRELLGADEKLEVKGIELRAAYWRKANHIHRWFVENVQSNEDDCGEYDVSREQLATLRDLCQSALDNRVKAADLLPTQDGFFFGSTAYGGGYFSDLSDTVEQINRALALPGEWHFTYQSSW